MSGNSTIEWTDKTWNPVTGCDRVSPGCDHCYAETIAKRFAGSKAFPQGFDLTLHPDRLDDPLKWRKPARVFVNSMSDLFHPDIPDDFIGNVFNTMMQAEQHTFQVLTKRPQRMETFVKMWLGESWGQWIDNLWLGTSIESDRYVFRADYLRETPAAVRFLSLEPLLGPLPSLDLTGIDWVIVGGESGPKARPMELSWARDLRDRCVAAGTPFLFKQWGEWAPDTEYEIVDGGLINHGEVSHSMSRIGKKAAGRELDGRLWDQFPA
jgi:protein gp37